MRVIERLNEIMMNVKTLDKYLDSKTDGSGNGYVREEAIPGETLT